MRVAANVYGQGGDDLSSEFWDLLAESGFHAQQCGACGKYRFPPNNVCPFCHSLAYEWAAICCKGTVYSHTTVRRAPDEEWAAVAPYVLAVVELAEGPLVLGHLQVGAESRVEIGDPVELVVVAHGSGRPIYEFQLARQSVGS
jgi:uncharacterized protein